MHFAPIIGKARADLLRDEHARPVCDLKAALDAVVICQRDEIHSGIAELIVKRARLRVAVRQTRASEEPLRGAVAEFRVKVKIGFQSGARASHA